MVVINSLDRLGRSTKNLLDLYDSFEAENVALVFLRERLDTSTPVGRLLRTLLSAIAEFERDLIAERTSTTLAARAGRGLHTGGAAPSGYHWTDDKTLVPDRDQAELERRIFSDYIDGMGQRAIVRALNAAGGRKWHQSAISRILSNVIYTGRLEYGKRGATARPTFDSQHEAIVSQDVFDRVRAIRTDANRPRSGRHPDGAHLLTRGLLRCSCGAAMIPRKARKGVERERYVCSGRIAEGGAVCSQLSIRRELIDEPFLHHLLEGHIDIEATVKRIEERTSSALVDARQALDEAERELQRCDARLARVQRGWQDDVIDDTEYVRQRTELLAEQEAATAAHERARAHGEQIEHAAVPGEAEQALLGYLAALKQAMGDRAGRAPDLAALRNVIGQMFSSVQLLRCRTSPDGYIVETPAEAAGTVLHPDWKDHIPAASDGEYVYLLWPALRSEAVDPSGRPIGHEMPVPWSGQYPHGFLCRYCWW